MAFAPEVFDGRSSSLLVLVVLLLLFGNIGLAWSQEVDSRLIGLAWERGEAELKVLLEETQEALEDVRQNLAYTKTPRFRSDNDKSVDEQRAAIEGLEQKAAKLEGRLATLKDTDTPIVPDVIGDIDVGEIGLWRYTTTVRQKISDREALLDVQVNDPYSKGTYLVYARGYDFSNVVDGRSYSFTGPVACLKTTTYTTALGTSRTVPLVQPLNLAEAAAKEKARRKNERRRTWSDSTGGPVRNLVSASRNG